MFPSHDHELQDDILELIDQKQPTSYDWPDLEKLQDLQEDLDSEITSIENDIQDQEAVVNQTNSEFKEFTDNFNDNQEVTTEILKEKIEKRSPIVKEFERNIKKITKEETELKQLIKIQKKKLDHLKTHEYDPNCKYCTSNIFIKEAEQAKQELPDNEIRLESKQKAIKHFQKQADRITETIFTTWIIFMCF